MTQLFTMPQLGSTMEDGLVALWLRHEGEEIRKGDPLVEVETDKTIVEVPAPFDGILQKILAPADTRVAIHQPLAIFVRSHDDLEELSGQPSLDGGAGTAELRSGTGALLPATDASETQTAGQDARVGISPRARRLAVENDVPFLELTRRGTGPGGRVIERDVTAYLEERQRSVPAPTPATVRSHLEPAPDMDALALGLPGSQAPGDVAAERDFRMSQEKPSLTRPGRDALAAGTAERLFMTLEVDMTACLALCAQLETAVQRTYGVPLTPLAFVVKTAARALAENPIRNSGAQSVAGSPDSSRDIALAVPARDEFAHSIIAGAKTGSLGAVAAELIELTGAALHGEPQAIDAAPSLTIVDVSEFGLGRFDFTLLSGQAAVLGLTRIADVAVVFEKQVEIRSMMNLCLTYDPRCFGILQAARFLAGTRTLLEAPASILV